ncbi:MAG: tetratricopeptide repeat protein [Planctomycetota bacterium]
MKAKFSRRGRWVATLAVTLAVSAAARGQAPESGGADEAMRVYLTGNGLLNRGLDDLAAAEYRKFLSDHATHEKAALARYGLAVSLFRTSHCDEALRELEPLLGLGSFEYGAETAVMAGQCHLLGGRFDRAAAALSAMLNGYADHDLADDASAALIEAEHRGGDHQAALKEAARFAERFSGSPLADRVEFFAAASEQATGQFAAAAKRLSALLEAFPTSSLAEPASLRLAQCRQGAGDSQEAIRGYVKILKSGPAAHAPEALGSLGALLYGEGQYPAAREALEQLISSHADAPQAQKAHLALGHVNYALGEFDRAMDAYKHSAQTDQTTADQAAYWSAKCLLRKDRFADAASALQEAAARFPESALLPQMFYDRAVACIRSEKPGEAIEALEAFLSRFPKHELASAAMYLAASTEHQRGDYDAGARYCALFLERFDGQSAAPSVYFLAAENEFLSERYGPAAEKYEVFLKRFAADSQADKARFRLGIALHRLGRASEAEPYLDAVVKAAPNDLLFRSAWLTLGDIRFDRGEWERAEKGYAAYLADGKDAPAGDDAALRMGLCRHRLDRLTEAIEAYDQVLSNHANSPHRVQAQFERGQALAALNQPAEAAKAFEAVLSEGGESSRFACHALRHLAAIAQTSGDPTKAAELLRRAAAAADETGLAPDLLLQQGQALLSARKFAEAEAALRRAVELDPKSPAASEAKAQWAMAVARQDRCADAVELISGLALSETSPGLRSSLRYEKAWCLRSLGRDDDAAAAYRELLSAEAPEKLAAHATLELAEMEASAGRFEEAGTLLRALPGLVDRLPADERASLVEQGTYRLGVCEFELARYDAARGCFDTVAESYPTSSLAPSSLFHGGEAAFRAGKFEAALVRITKLIERHPDDASIASAFLRQGETLAALQRWAASERAFARYLERFPEGEGKSQARFGVGFACENQKRYDEAIRAYGRVVESSSSPTAARAQFQIGECLFAQGKHEEAVRELLKVDILYAYAEWSAAALFEAARCFEKLDKPQEAQRHFRQVADQYGDSSWGKMALARLSELTSSAVVPGR